MSLRRVATQAQPSSMLSTIPFSVCMRATSHICAICLTSTGSPFLGSVVLGVKASIRSRAVRASAFIASGTVTTLTGVLPASPARKGGVKGSYTKISVFLSGKPRPGGRGGFTCPIFSAVHNRIFRMILNMLGHKE